MFRKPKKWEYHKIVVTLGQSSQALDDLGQGGWEAYESYPHAPAPAAHNVDYKIVVMLKRRVK